MANLTNGNKYISNQSCIDQVTYFSINIKKLVQFFGVFEFWQLKILAGGGGGEDGPIAETWEILASMMMMMVSVRIISNVFISKQRFIVQKPAVLQE